MGTMTKREDSYRQLLRLSQPEQQLLLMAGLPIIDGVYLGALAGGVLHNVPSAVTFGLVVFGGSGCLAAGLALEGSALRRALAVVRVYGTVALGALLAFVILRLTGGRILPQFHLFSALVVLSIAAEMLGLALAPADPLPETNGGRWLWSLRALVVPQVVLTVGLAVSVLYAVTAGATPVGGGPTGDPVLGMLAVMAGFGETLLGAVVAAPLSRRLDRKWAGRGAGASLAVIALIILGAPIPAAVPFAALLIGLVGGLAVGRREGCGGVG